jgi:hypothetical protein
MLRLAVRQVASASKEAPCADIVAQASLSAVGPDGQELPKYPEEIRQEEEAKKDADIEAKGEWGIRRAVVETAPYLVPAALFLGFFWMVKKVKSS